MEGQLWRLLSIELKVILYSSPKPLAVFRPRIFQQLKRRTQEQDWTVSMQEAIQSEDEKGEDLQIWWHR